MKGDSKKDKNVLPDDDEKLIESPEETDNEIFEDDSEFFVEED